jgi:Ca2+:H+ antiporter
MSNIDSIKRAARKEAWYGDSYNPFRKVRSSTWGTQRDEEQADGPNNRLSQVQTEPLPESPRMDNDERAGADHPARTTNASTVVDPSMTAARTSEPGSGSGAASTEKESENFPAASDDTKTQDGPRRRLGFFHKDKGGDDQAAEEEVEKKRPWWKGKDLYHAEPFTIRNQVQRTIFNSWVNILLLCAPVGIALNYVGVDGKAVFVVNFIAIIPLAGLLSFATEEIALHVGESLGGLLNASFG